MSGFDSLRQSKKPVKREQELQEGYIWMSMLIRFTTDGKSEIIRSFAKPAKESSIKGIVKTKKQVFKPKIETNIEKGKLF